MALTRTVILIAAAIGAVILGFHASLKYGREADGFDSGVYLGGIVSLLAGTMLGYLLAGWGEATLGEAVGLPLGMFCGSFLGVASSSTIFGLIGRLISSILNE